MSKVAVFKGPFIKEGLWNNLIREVSFVSCSKSVMKTNLQTS